MQNKTGGDVDIFLSVGDTGVCGTHGCELEVDVVEVRNLDTGTVSAESVIFCPECLAATRNDVPEILDSKTAICPVHHCFYTEEVYIEEYDPELDAPAPGLGYSCPICVEEYQKAHPKPPSSTPDPDIPF